MPCKPINFVPYVDEFLKFYFKKDSLWFSENLASVPDHDANRVCVLQVRGCPRGGAYLLQCHCCS